MNITEFTVGNDYLLDKELVKYDCKGSIAHAKMLKKIGVLGSGECSKLVKELNGIEDMNITIDDEDCHMAIEKYLTEKLGDLGKKIHTCRSRNDQVLTALRLYEKDQLKEVKNKIIAFIQSLEKKKSGKSMVGYTHMQPAMPMTVSMWLGSFLESMKDNLKVIEFLLDYIDKSPLGSAAGFGVPVFKVDKEFSANEMGFSDVFENPMSVQLSRGKYEVQIINGLCGVMIDLNKLATDLIIFNMLGHVNLPECTGSSIMPQKKNPDVLELVRAKYHVIVGEEMKVKGIIGNLMSGYNRDLQLTKEPVMNSFKIVNECLEIMAEFVLQVEVNDIELPKEIFAVEKAYKMVKKGVPFRDAYNEVKEGYK